MRQRTCQLTPCDLCIKFSPHRDIWPFDFCRTLPILSKTFTIKIVVMKTQCKKWGLGKILVSTHLDIDKASWHGSAQVTPVENANSLVWNLAPPARVAVPRFQFSALHQSLPRSVGVFISFCIFPSGRPRGGTFAIPTPGPPTASANITDSRTNLSHFSHFLSLSQISSPFDIFSLWRYLFHQPKSSFPKSRGFWREVKGRELLRLDIWICVLIRTKSWISPQYWSQTRFLLCWCHQRDSLCIFIF